MLDLLDDNAGRDQYLAQSEMFAGQSRALGVLDQATAAKVKGSAKSKSSGVARHS